MPNLPQIPVFDAVLGLLSALLLVAAALYLVRARSSAAAPLAQLRTGRPAGNDYGELFTETVPDVTAHRLSFVASLFLHVLLVSSLPVLELLEPGPLLFDLHHYDVVLLEYRAPDAPFSMPKDVAEAYKSNPAEPESQGEEPFGLPEAQNEQTQRAQGPFEGLVVALTARQQQEPVPPPLIEITADAELGIGSGNLPAMPSALESSLADQQAGLLAQIRPTRFEMPGEQAAAPGQTSLAELGMADTPQVRDNPALPVPLGSDLVEGGLWSSLDGLSGVQSPGGGGLSGAPAPGLDGGMFSPGADGAGGGGDIVSALAFHLAMQEGSLGQLFGEGSLVALGGSGENLPFRTGSADGPESGGWGRGKLTPVPRKFHGIILVSNSLSTLPEAVGVLSGNPVYTVYVDVPNAPRKWILQFCVPQGPESGVQFNGGVVRVLGRQTVDPPYAFHKEPPHLEIVPTLERLARLPPRVVAYATVDQEGNLNNIRMIRGADPETDRLILASLRSWEFTPAFRDGVPVEVEALFGIPLY